MSIRISLDDPPEFYTNLDHICGRIALTLSRAEQIGVIVLPGSREVYDYSRKIWEATPDAGISRVTLTGYAGW